MQVDDLPQGEMSHQARRRYSSSFFRRTRSAAALNSSSGQQIRDRGTGKLLGRQLKALGRLAEPLDLHRRKINGECHGRTLPCCQVWSNDAVQSTGARDARSDG